MVSPGARRADWRPAVPTATTPPRRPAAGQGAPRAARTSLPAGADAEPARKRARARAPAAPGTCSRSRRPHPGLGPRTAPEPTARARARARACAPEPARRRPGPRPDSQQDPTARRGAGAPGAEPTGVGFLSGTDLGREILAAHPTHPDREGSLVFLTSCSRSQHQTHCPPVYFNSHWASKTMIFMDTDCHIFLLWSCWLSPLSPLVLKGSSVLDFLCFQFLSVPVYILQSSRICKETLGANHHWAWLVTDIIQHMEEEPTKEGASRANMSNEMTQEMLFLVLQWIKRCVSKTFKNRIGK
ncbi:uncharacterized protein LOC142440234 [Tenrec ecaudatus]|uniref:uncharacterized protein LOC142440234 n=1 Tax=Tenrec ecaudatus TaxID=94439 RepID=UPI003F5A2AB5